MQRGFPIGRIITVLFVCVWSLFPIYWAINTSFMNNATAQATPAHFLPNPFDLSNYKMLFSSAPDTGLWPDFRQSLINTTVECVVATIATVVIAVFSSYAFARLKFRGRNVLFYTALATLSLPAYATLIPLYKMMSQLHLVNTYLGLLLVYVSGFIPLAMWILYNYFASIPQELEEAAFVDGATPTVTLFRIMLPLSMPGITSTAIITLLTAWGQFLFPLVLTSDITTQPLTVFMTGLQGRHTVPYTLMNATGVLSILVPALIVVFLNRYIIRGILAGSGK